MNPTLKEGDLIIYRPFKKNNHVLSEGLLVIINHPLKEKTLIVKRISKISDEAIEVIGDNQAKSIDSRQFGKIHSNKIEGIVEKIFHL